MTSVPARPAGSNTINPFLMTDDAARIIAFLIDVFGAVDVAEARTLDTDGLILHSELRIGDSVITIADRKPDWPFTPGFVQVYVDDVEATLERAQRLGARIVTRPTDFFGDTFSRFSDPSGNLWWVYRHEPQAASEWSAESDAEGGADWEADGADGAAGAEDWSDFSSPELEYIHESLVAAMSALRDPRSLAEGALPHRCRAMPRSGTDAGPKAHLQVRNAVSDPASVLSTCKCAAAPSGSRQVEEAGGVRDQHPLHGIHADEGPQPGEVPVAEVGEAGHAPVGDVASAARDVAAEKDAVSSHL